MEMLKWVQFKVPTPVSMRILLKYPKSSDILNKFPCSMKCILIQIYPQSSAHRFFLTLSKFGVPRFEQFRKTPWLACVFNYRNVLFNQHDVWYTPKIEILSSLTFCRPCPPPLPSDRVAGWGVWRRRSWIYAFSPDLCHSAHPGRDTLKISTSLS